MCKREGMVEEKEKGITRRKEGDVRLARERKERKSVGNKVKRKSEKRSQKREGVGRKKRNVGKSDSASHNTRLAESCSYCPSPVTL